MAKKPIRITEEATKPEEKQFKGAPIEGRKDMVTIEDVLAREKQK